ncbi:MAG: hypothetical protein M3N39_05310, partial [Pseudomonadota bacterium]|nr:hypothetical protein [Pseudomonadota bacterium]
AAFARIVGSDLFSIYYWLPIALNMLAVPAFCFLAAQVTKDRVAFFCASILYVQLPDSFVWQITGGGLPRSLAALFALLAVGVAVRTAYTPLRQMLLSGVAVGVSILSHLEWGVFAAAGVTLAFLAGAENWKNRIVLIAGTGLIALLVISPWTAFILARHGLDPFLSSSSASNWNLGNFVGSTFTGRIFGLLVWPAMLGAFVTMSRRNWFLISWTITTILLTPRMGANVGLAIPASLLAGHGFKAAAEFATNIIASARGFVGSRFQFAIRSWFGVGLPAIGLLAFSSLALASPFGSIYHDPQIVEQLDRPSRDAMRWIRERTDPRSDFVVISNTEHWFVDRVAEWFPFLTDRNSLTTAQGLEWAGPGVFVAKTNELNSLKSVQKVAPNLIASLVREQYCGADYVALFSRPDAAERQAFLDSGFYRLVFANEKASVFRFQGAEVCKRSPRPSGIG